MKKITQSYTIGISTKVVELKKEGIDICDLSIGDPDFKVPQKAINYGIESLSKNITKYNLVNGMEILRKEISKKLSNDEQIVSITLFSILSPHTIRLNHFSLFLKI